MRRSAAMKLHNERGAALLYVMMISMLLIIVVPTVLYLGSNSDLQNVRSEKEKIVNQLAVSGMQAIARYPGTVEQKLAFLQVHYGKTMITQPDGLNVEYHQYAVNANDEPELGNMVATTALVSNGNYDVVVQASIGTIEKKVIGNFDLSGYGGDITSVVLNPPFQVVGSLDGLLITVYTENLSARQKLTVKLDGVSPLATVVCEIELDGTCTGNFANLSGLVPGLYEILVYRGEGTTGAILFGDVVGENVKFEVRGTLDMTVPTNFHFKDGNPKTFNVTVQASGIASGVQFTIELLNSAGSPLPTRVYQNGTFGPGGTGALSFTIPATAGPGDYILRATVVNYGSDEQIYKIGSFGTVTTYPTVHKAGEFQMVAVSIPTVNVPEDTTVNVQFIRNDGISLSPPIVGTGTIHNNKANSLLQIPADIVKFPVGLYRIKVTILGISIQSTTYNISNNAPPASAMIVDSDGNVVPLTVQDIQDGSVVTNGTLFIPDSYGNIIMDPNQEVIFTAPAGIYVGANIFTDLNGENITLKACRGPININDATISTTFGADHIRMEAGTYISAINTNFTANKISLIANDYINLTDANVITHSSGAVITLSAFNNTSKIITTNASFNYITNNSIQNITPNKLANGGVGVPCS
jgi:hypothetical protein